MAGISPDPDQIRTIREGLGLSQRQAGNLLGGGPDAFPKYESGAVVPRAALVKLLLVLRDNPAPSALCSFIGPSQTLPGNPCRSG